MHPCVVIGIERLSPETTIAIEATRPETPVFGALTARLRDAFAIGRKRLAESFGMAAELLPKAEFSVAVERTCEEVVLWYFSASDGAFLTKEGYRILVNV